MSRNPLQFELFDADKASFPVRSATDQLDIEKFRSRIKRAMARAIRECPHDRSVIAARMAQYLGLPTISRATLDAYTAESKPHDPSLSRFKAFVRATGAYWLWDEVIKDDGLTLLAGEEALLAQIGEIQKERAELGKQLKALMATRINVKDVRR